MYPIRHRIVDNIENQFIVEYNKPPKRKRHFILEMKIRLATKPFQLFRDMTWTREKGWLMNDLHELEKVPN